MAKLIVEKRIRIALAMTAITCLYRCMADVGTAISYGPPYVPTACYGNDLEQFPAGNLFAAASNAIWDRGAACGRRYAVRCLSGTDQTVGKPCKAGAGTITVEIVDHCYPNCGGTLELSTDAFAVIANSTAHAITVEYYRT